MISNKSAKRPIHKSQMKEKKQKSNRMMAMTKKANKIFKINIFIDKLFGFFKIY